MKRMYTFLSLILILVLSISVQAQRNCGAMENLDRLLQENPAMQQNMETIERLTQEFLKNTENINTRAVITIPVVVHVVYKTNSQNISDAQIASQIEVLNDDFRRMNSDANNTWPQADDTEIQFCLASVDPDGNPTNGIERRKTNKPSFGTNDQMKFNSSGGLDAWPAGDYLNIWSCNINQYLGYAQFPGGNAATDGVVIDYAYFGSGGSAQAPFDLGRTGTHEVGHWLNLRHIWGDSPCGGNGDYVGDTPDSDGPNYGCATGHVSCGSVDMVQNYMDYSDDDCMNLFTSGQGNRMNAIFSSNAMRGDLLSSNGCGGGGAEPTCDDGIQNQGEDGIDCGAVCGYVCPEPTCDIPTGTQAVSIKKKTAKLDWNAANGATSYTVQYRATGSSNWTTKTTSSTIVTATGLSAGTTYEWQVQSNCSGGNSEWTSICTFTAGSGNSSSCNGSARLITDQVQILPNPASDDVMIRWSDLEEENADLFIYNSIGKVVEKISIGSINGSVELDISNWNKGMYFVRISAVDGISSIQKLIVQ